MNKDSLTLAKNLIIDALEKNKDININDRVELMINLFYFLNENKYEDNIKVLSKGKTNDSCYYRRKK